MPVPRKAASENIKPTVARFVRQQQIFLPSLPKLRRNQVLLNKNDAAVIRLQGSRENIPGISPQARQDFRGRVLPYEH